MEIKQIKFLMSNQDHTSLPKANLPEYAFVGRSNVGKSSLINAMANQKKLAKTSSTPGKTQLINHFLVNENWYLVDLPGYGYAKVSKSQRKKFTKMIQDYILQRPNLMNVFVLVDSRHPLQEPDKEFFEFLGLSQIPFAIVFTKMDKLKNSEKKDNIEAYKTEMLKDWEELPKLFFTSAEKKDGLKDILEYIEEVNPIFWKHFENQ